jgi:hypothetical protein
VPEGAPALVVSLIVLLAATAMGDSGTQKYGKYQGTAAISGSVQQRASLTRIVATILWPRSVVRPQRTRQCRLH